MINNQIEFGDFFYLGTSLRETSAEFNHACFWETVIRQTIGNSNRLTHTNTHFVGGQQTSEQLTQKWRMVYVSKINKTTITTTTIN